MFVVVVGIAAAFFSYGQVEKKRRAQELREQAEEVLEFILSNLQYRLTALGEYGSLDDIQRQVDNYYKRIGSAGDRQARRGFGTLSKSAGDS
jgi:hypothetical protein